MHDRENKVLTADFVLARNLLRISITEAARR
jgi:hypothetical protein